MFECSVRFYLDAIEYSVFDRLIAEGNNLGFTDHFVVDVQNLYLEDIISFSYSADIGADITVCIGHPL